VQKITPFLWFDHQAEEAMNFYTSVFKNSKAGNIIRYGKAGPGPEGSVLTATFELEGLKFTALNGGPQFPFTPAISLVVACESQDEVDYYWSKLSEGGQIQQCGWLNDRFGISWQIVPTLLPTLLGDSDRDKANRVMQAMMQMQKIEIAKLQQAAAG
jgi:predicted 3-demethylubiquinone-9 3-methyltransferase (glyoxalase superfamily)